MRLLERIWVAYCVGCYGAVLLLGWMEIRRELPMGTVLLATIPMIVGSWIFNLIWTVIDLETQRKRHVGYK